MLSLVIFLKKFASCRLFFLRCYENRRSIQDVDNENTGSLKKITFAKKCKIHVFPIPREIPLLNSPFPEPLVYIRRRTLKQIIFWEREYCLPGFVMISTNRKAHWQRFSSTGISRVFANSQ